MFDIFIVKLDQKLNLKMKILSFEVNVKIYSRITRTLFEAFEGLYNGMIKVEFTVQWYINRTLTDLDVKIKINFFIRK